MWQRESVAPMERFRGAYQRRRIVEKIVGRARLLELLCRRYVWAFVTG